MKEQYLTFRKNVLEPETFHDVVNKSMLTCLFHIWVVFHYVLSPEFDT